MNYFRGLLFVNLGVIILQLHLELTVDSNSYTVINFEDVAERITLSSTYVTKEKSLMWKHGQGEESKQEGYETHNFIFSQ